eukprot:5977436-Pyramimonas_sp.AAC.1
MSDGLASQVLDEVEPEVELVNCNDREACRKQREKANPVPRPPSIPPPSRSRSPGRAGQQTPRSTRRRRSSSMASDHRQGVRGGGKDKDKDNGKGFGKGCKDKDK